MDDRTTRLPHRSRPTAVPLARTFPQPSPSPGDVLAGLRSVGRELRRVAVRLIEATARRRLERRAIADLRRIDRRVLKDIGVDPTEIGSLVRHGQTDWTRRSR